MFNTARDIRRSSDDERLRAWRLERQKVAEIQRQERLAERARQAEADLEQQDEERQKSADAHKPKAEEERSAKRAITRRRWWASIALSLQFSLFVLMPVALASWYLWFVATPLIEARTVVFFENAHSDLETVEASRPFSRQAASGLQQAFAANSLINSKAMVDKLEDENSALSAFSSERLDPLQRIRSLPQLTWTQERQFRKFVRSDVDVQTGFLMLRVLADDPAFASLLSSTVLEEIETKLALAETLSADQAQGIADARIKDAEQALRAARASLSALQVTHQMTDPSIVIAQRLTEIESLRSEVETISSEIRRSNIVGRGDHFKTQQNLELRDALTREISHLEEAFTAGSPSLPEISAAFDASRLEIELAEIRLASAHQTMSVVTESTANNQTQMRIVVPTGTTDIPVYPDKIGVLTVVFAFGLAVFLFGRLTIFRPRHHLI